MQGEENGDAWELKRHDFRNEIRRKQIDTIKKKKRSMFQAQTSLSHPIYTNALNNPQLIYQNGPQYLQILKETFSWEGIGHFNQKMPDILLRLINFYENNQLMGTDRFLFWECIGCIYFQTSIPFFEINKRIVELCRQNMQPNDMELLCRCVIVLENMTFTTNEAIINMVLETGVLLDLEDWIQTYPFNSNFKLEILKLLGNLIVNLLKNSGGEYSPSLIFYCLEENYDYEAMERGVELCRALISDDKIDKASLLQDMEIFLRSLSQSPSYVAQTELLCTNLPENSNFDFQQYYVLMQKIICSLAQNQFQKDSLKHYINSCTLLVTGWPRVQGLASCSDALTELTEGVFNLWLNSGDAYFYAEYELLNFILAVAQYEGLFHAVLYSNKNYMQATIWELIVEFLKNVSLEKQQCMFPYVKIVSLRDLPKMIPHPYLLDIYYKLQSCYDALNNEDMSQKPYVFLAETALDNMQRLL